VADQTAAPKRGTATAPKDIAVIGAGIVGVCTALHLTRDGHRVTVIDPKPPGRATSFGNAGAISVGGVYPVGTPGNWKQVPSMLMDPASALSIRWSYLPRMAPWLIRFLRESTPTRVQANSTAMAAISKDAVNAHNTLIRDYGIDGIVKPVGWLKVYSSQAGFDKAAEDRRVMIERGVTVQILSQLEPGLSHHFTHASFQPDNAFVSSPVKLTEAYAAAFTRLGGRFAQERVIRFETDGRGRPTKVVTDLAMHPVDAVVICAGAWSGRIAALLKRKLLLDTERGYHLNLEVERGPELRRPTVIGDHGFVLAPMQDGLRLTTGAELAGIDAPPDFARARRMLPAVKKVLPGIQFDVTREWLGFRPSVPDSVPVVSADPYMDNVFYNYGHGHLGLTMSARTAEILAGLVAGRTSELDLSPYRVERF
jgi:D-amino-acid dehydrogenase